MKRVRKKRKQNDLLTFLGGLAMLVAGLYWLTSRVSVSTSFFGGTMALGGFHFNSGMIVVPFIVCIVWLFMDPDSFFAKICVGLSVILIIAAIILNTQLHMRSTSLYEYLIMLIFIFGGGAMVLKVLCNPKYRDIDENNASSEYEQIKTANNVDDYADEIEAIRRNSGK